MRLIACEMQINWLGLHLDPKGRCASKKMVSEQSLSNSHAKPVVLQRPGSIGTEWYADSESTFIEKYPGFASQPDSSIVSYRTVRCPSQTVHCITFGSADVLNQPNLCLTFWDGSKGAYNNCLPVSQNAEILFNLMFYLFFCQLAP